MQYLRNPPHWVPWLIPLVLFQLATRISLSVQIVPGVAIWYLPIPLGLILIHLWGPRILPALYLNALLSAGLWGLPQMQFWPLYAWPETLEVFLSWFLFRYLAQGKPELSNTQELSKFLVLGILVPIMIGSVAVPVQLALLGNLPMGSIMESIRIGLPGDLISSVAITLPALILLYGKDESLFTSSLHPLSLTVLGLVCIAGGFLLPPLESWWYYALILAFVSTSSGVGYTLLFNFVILLSALLQPFRGLSVLGYTPSTLKMADLYLGMAVLASTSLLIARSIADMRVEIRRRKDLERRNQAFIDGNPDLLFMLNQEGLFLDYRANSFQLYRTPDMFIGRHLSEVLNEEIAQLTYKAMKEARSTGRPANYYYFLQFETLRHYEARMICYLNDYLIFVRDVTEQRANEQEKQRLIQELKARNQEMEKFAYTVSHDLKSPLVTIRGFLRMVDDDFKSGNHSDIPESLMRIDKAATKMGALLADLLQLSRVGRLTNPPTWNSLPEMIRDTCEFLEGILSKNNAVIEVKTGELELFGDRNRLMEVIQNVVENAIKYRSPERTPHLVFAIRPESDRMICTIQDNGIGIDPKFLQQIFGLFNKLDNRTEGTGIGLALVKRIIEHHGGEAWIESLGTNQGSTFCFWLPGHRAGPTA